MKADPKMKAEPEATAANPAAKGSKKKILVVVAVLVVAVGGASAVAWHFMHTPKAEHKEVKVEAPVFVNLEPFTVNLQQETGEQFLQTSITLQVENIDQIEEVKNNMPQVRSRLLMLLSSKKASEISTTEGKNKLTAEIIAQLKKPFVPGAKPQGISGVFFTSFIIQ